MALRLGGSAAGRGAGGALERVLWRAASSSATSPALVAVSTSRMSSSFATASCSCPASRQRALASSRTRLGVRRLGERAQGCAGDALRVRTLFTSKTTAESSSTSTSSSAGAATEAPSSSSHTEGRRPYSRLPSGPLGKLFLLVVGITPFALLFEMNWYSVHVITQGSMAPTLNPSREAQSTSKDMLGFCDWVLLNRRVVRKGHFQRGDIVLLRHPAKPDLLTCKRIIALEGDIVRVRVPGSGAADAAAQYPSESDYTRRRARVPSSEPLSHTLKSGRDEAGDEGNATDAELGESWTEIPLDDGRRLRHEERRRLAEGLRDNAEDAISERYKLVRIPPGHAWVEGDAGAPADGSSRGWSMGRSCDSRSYGPVSLALVTARVDYIVWPPNRIGRPGKRSDINMGTPLRPAGAGSTEQAQLVRKSTSARLRTGRIVPLEGDAHPDDSHISPYVLDSSPPIAR